MVICPSCHADLETDARFCDRCGSALDQATVVEQPRRALLIGALPDNHVVLEREDVSGYHAVVWSDGDDSWIADLGSTNGTFVDAQRIRGSVELSPHASLRLGATRVDVGALRDAIAGGDKALLVGRYLGADRIVDATVVSSRHLLLLERGESWVALDLGSANGTAVGQPGNTIPGPTPVDPAATLFLGSYPIQAQALISGAADGTEPQAALAGQGVCVGDGPVVLGRAPGCDVVVPFPTVSLRHARLTPQPDGGCVLEDLGSSNGTYYGGQQIRRVTIPPGSTFSLGSHPLHLEERGTLRAPPTRSAIRLEGRNVTRIVKHRQTGRPLTLVDDVSVAIQPSEFVGLMGPSGAGKTTVMLALNGYERPTGGSVQLNGEDLYRNYDRFRGMIGYLPQDDIIHKELTVRESLYYTARLRLPPDTTRREIDERIRRVLEELNLLDQQDQLIGSVEQKVLSGGQRKRVNLAQELVTDPLLLFLDEPTSGLSAKDTADVMQVLRNLADQGRTIVLTIHQPSPDVYAQMDHVMLLARGGKLAYFGPTEPDSYRYFEVGDRNPDRLMARLDDQAPDEWQTRYAGSDAYRKHVAERLSDEPQPGRKGAARRAKRPKVPAFAQWRTLVSRYARIKLRDRANMTFVALQAPVVAVLLSLVFRYAADEPTQRHLALFFACIAALFFGCFNASREIVAEWAIFRRERMVNLRLVPYLASKFAVLGLIGLVQMLILYPPLAWFVGLDGPSWKYLPMLTATVVAATALGLAISCVARSVEAAMAIVPIILIPQILLAGIIVPLDREWYIEWMSLPMTSRWSIEGLMDIEREGLDDESAMDSEAWSALEDTETTARSGAGSAPDGETGSAGEIEPPQPADAASPVPGFGQPPPSPRARFGALMEDRHLTAQRAGFDLWVLFGFTAVTLVGCVVLLKRRERKG